MRSATRTRSGPLPRTLFAALTLLAATVAPSGVMAQTKSQSTARAIAFFVPGGGHLYAGEQGRGLFLLAAAAGAATAGIMTSEVYTWDYTCRTSNCMDPNGGPKYSRLYLGIGVAGAIWLYSLYDASHAAERENRRAAQRVSLRPFARVERQGLRPGLAVSIAF
jgi:hypothetical protein